MGTSSCIAIPLDNGFKGRYVHWDGYPTAMAASLNAIVRRDGVELTRTVLIVNHYSWSSVDSDQAEKEPSFPERFAIVPGYGECHTDVAANDWILSQDPAGDIEWAYILNDDRISVLMAVDDKWVHVGDVLHTQVPTDKDLEDIECGKEYEHCGHLAVGHFPDADYGVTMEQYLKLAQKENTA